MKLLLLVILIPQTLGKLQVFMKSANITSKPEFVRSEIALLVNPRDDTDWSITIQGLYLQKLKTMRFRTQMFSKISSSRLEKFYDRTYSYCKTNGRKAGADVISNLMLSLWLNRGNLTQKCPVEPGMYVIPNITIDYSRTSNIPYFGGKRDVLVVMSFYSVVEKKLVKITEIFLDGGYKNQ